jgi:hypothetical protein
MPTSKNWPGTAFARCESPVPLGMAPVMPTMFDRLRANRDQRARRRHPGNWAACRGDLLALAGAGVEGAGAVELLGRVDGGVEALALLGQHVDEHGHVAVLGELEVLDQGVEIVAVHRAEVAQAEFLEEGRLDEEVLRLALPLG